MVNISLKCQQFLKDFFNGLLHHQQGYSNWLSQTSVASISSRTRSSSSLNNDSASSSFSPYGVACVWDRETFRGAYWAGHGAYHFFEFLFNLPITGKKSYGVIPAHEDAFSVPRTADTFQRGLLSHSQVRRMKTFKRSKMEVRLPVFLVEAQFEFSLGNEVILPRGREELVQEGGSTFHVN